MDVIHLTERTTRLIDSISEAMLSSMEAATEKISLATEVAKVQLRMAAFSAVLECIDAQRQPLLERLEHGSAAERKLCQIRLEMLAHQEAGVLERAGAPAAVAAQVVQQTLAIEHTSDTDVIRVPAHSRRKPSRNGAAVTEDN